MSDADAIRAVRQRLARLEQRMDQEAGLRASQDRDLATLGTRMDAARHLIQAVAITQGEHTEALQRLEQLSMRIQARLEHIVVLLTGLSEQEGGTNERA